MVVHLWPSESALRSRRAAWHRWFAWHPVRIGKRGEFRWLEWVERRTILFNRLSITFYRRARAE